MAECLLFEGGMCAGGAKCNAQENSEQEKERVKYIQFPSNILASTHILYKRVGL